MVPFQDWLTRLSSRGRNDTNPFVVGRAEYQKFLDVIEGAADRPRTPWTLGGPIVT
jgi:hypothetical protein